MKRFDQHLAWYDDNLPFSFLGACSLHALPQFLLKLIGHISFFFTQIHYPRRPDFDFHKYMIRALEYEFKRVVGIRLVS